MEGVHGRQAAEAKLIVVQAGLPQYGSVNSILGAHLQHFKARAEMTARASEVLRRPRADRDEVEVELETGWSSCLIRYRSWIALSGIHCLSSRQEFLEGQRRIGKNEGRSQAVGTEV